ncbi:MULTISPECIES: hypothetical protein [Salmonella]|uniref:hypothetical protein n=1 Tax=Salmonella TaxID=590 RepID=UPI002A1D9EF8|nr:hypothetical protein [Salmonella enterica]MDJ5156358.1 hypothetical protein [Salmonella enterica]MDJ5160715.1 hypothetical protein [Salmonella enterica]
MNKEIALKIVIDKLLGDNSIPVRLRLKRDFSDDEVENLYKALDFLAEVYADESTVPKILGLALMDVYGMFSFR